VNLDRIQKIVGRDNLEAYRTEQVTRAFFKKHVSSFTEISTLGKDLRRLIADEQPVLTLSLRKLLVSKKRDCYKALLELQDGHLVETVLMKLKPNHLTACISSQVGCGLGCTFCATGRMGLLRNLSSEEITDQVLFWRQYIHAEKFSLKLKNVVYMGMGEPLQNRRNVFDSIEELMNSRTFGVGARHISVSTSGLTKPILEFAERFPQVNLAISLHAANNALRTRLMPVNKAHPLKKLAGTLNEYLRRTNRKIFLEYILLEGENDSIDQAQELARYLRTIKPARLIHVNLIVYNPTDTAHRPSSRHAAEKFRNYLSRDGFNVTIRKNLGRDISGACGQLAVSPKVQVVKI
jgi:23S rRNA (adenine2503-C2)-methyltransferase